MAVRNSRFTPEQIASFVAANPIRIAEKTGNIITCPVRLAFPALWEPDKNVNDAGETTEKYSVVALFPPGAEAGINGIMNVQYFEHLRKAWSSNIGPDGVPFGLHQPFHRQDEKANQYGGFTPGLIYINAGSQMKPKIVDNANNPIVDKSRVYPGVWAILALNTYAFGVGAGAGNKKGWKKGIGFGLQNVMIFADDETFGGGGTDPADDFAGVKFDAGFVPSAAFGNAPPAPVAAPPVPQSILPASQPVYAPPAPAVAPYSPGQVWAPPAQPEPESFF